MSGGGPNPGQFIPTNSPTPYDSSQYESPVVQYSDAQRSGPPQANIPYTPEAQQQQGYFANGRMYQQNGTLQQDENGQMVRVMQGGGSTPQSTLSQPVGPSASSWSSGINNTNLGFGGGVQGGPPQVTQGGLFDNLGGYGGRRGPPGGLR